MKSKTTIYTLVISLIVLLFILYLYSNKTKEQHPTSKDTTALLQKDNIEDSLEQLSRPEIEQSEKQQKDTTSLVDNNATKEPTAVNTTDSSKKNEKLWPVKTPPLLPGSLLPSHRIIAFYGNLYSKRMGILGEYPPDTVLKKLQHRVKQWQKADSSKTVIPALQLITMSGQLDPGRDSLYRMRMPFWMVDSVINMANSINGIVFLDFQVGKSTVEKEIPYYEKYLKMPKVHLAVDPEFYMKRGNNPGTRIGTMDAKDINYCINYLTKLVKKYDLPPKLFVIHRFTQGMVTNYKKIKLQSQVQVIMDMDGFGAQALKIDAYKHFIYQEPVEYTGIKLFLKNDNANGHKILSPKDVLALHPQPLYIQYQ